MVGASCLIFDAYSLNADNRVEGFGLLAVIEGLPLRDGPTAITRTPIWTASLSRSEIKPRCYRPVSDTRNTIHKYVMQ